MAIEILKYDCVEYMRACDNDQFDLAIVDPPYGIGDFRDSRMRRKHKAIDWNDSIPGPEYFDQLYRVSKHQIIFGANYYGGLIRDPGRIVHDKTGGNRKPQLPSMSDADIASQSFNNRIKIFHFIWQGNVTPAGINPDGHVRYHPCQKPVELYLWILRHYALTSDWVLDTHLGSGSSAIAASRFGCNFTGVEIDPHYVDVARERLITETAQEDAFGWT